MKQIPSRSDPLRSEGIMSVIEIRVPSLGGKAKVGWFRWLASDGAHVRADQEILLIETNSLPAKADGVLERIAAEGTTLVEGQLLGRLTEKAFDYNKPPIELEYSSTANEQKRDLEAEAERRRKIEDYNEATFGERQPFLGAMRRVAIYAVV